MNSLDNLIRQFSDFGGNEKVYNIPPVERWNPSLSGDIDILIKSNGEWLHDGSPIRRPLLVKLFSSILKKEGSDYFLVTPVEKWHLHVEDAPLLITEYKQQEIDGQPCLVLKTKTEDIVLLSDRHPLFMRDKKPYVLIRNNLEALVHRNVFYQWQELLEVKDGRHGIWSAGSFFELG